MLLYKFSTAEGALAILKFNSIFVTSPLDLNDPFEMRPAWTSEHELRQFQNEDLKNRILGGTNLLICTEKGAVDSGQTMLYRPASPPQDVELQRGIADSNNKGVFEQLHAKLRVLSLVPNILEAEESSVQREENATLMWAHYGDQFQGMCIALDPAKFFNGVQAHGYEVSYGEERRTLPVEHYDSILKLMAARPIQTGNVVDPSSGLELPWALAAHLRRQRFIDILIHKSPAWKYEQEIRMIYDLEELITTSEYRQVWLACQNCGAKNLRANDCEHPTFRDAVAIPAEAVQAVIFGTDCQISSTNEALRVLAEPRYQHVKLYWSSLHSSRYVVQYNEDTPEYVRFMQSQMALDVGQAKGHEFWHNGQLKVRVAAKGINYPGSASSL
ncbi:MAG: DUF2971 domain-containing protein [Verrucomicrobiota bacterium]